MILENRYGLQHLIENTWPELGENVPKIGDLTHKGVQKSTARKAPQWVHPTGSAETGTKYCLQILGSTAF